MITVKLYGSLKSCLNVAQDLTFNNCTRLTHVINALNTNYKKFRLYLNNHKSSPFVVRINDKVIDKNSLVTSGLSEGDTVHIIPVIAGSGEDWGSWLSIIVGIILIILTDGVVGWEQIGFAMGASMILSGVSQILFKPEEVEPSTYEPQNQSKISYAFQGAMNTVQQGNCVPLGYGRLRTGSQVIGAGLHAVSL